MCALVGVLAVSSAHAQAPPLREFVAAVEAIVPDPDETLFETHYITSNERHHTASLAHAHETGGVFIGIGTDQNFVVIPRVRPSHIVMVDFDQWAVDAHGIYRHLLRTRGTPSEFLSFFEAVQVPSKRRELREHGATPEDGQRMERVYARYRPEILKRLRSVRNRLNGKSITGYLNDQATYEYLREFVLTGRYAALRGDLTQERSLTALAKTLKSMSLQVGAVVLSNAEQYFDYTPNFKRNMRAFDFRPNALVFRTFRVGGRHYEYYLQSAAAFLESLEAPHIKNISRLIARRLATPHPRIFLLPGLKRCLAGLCPIIDACHGILHGGCCDGTTLRWCLFGTLQSLDCARSTPATCGWSPKDAMLACVARTEGPALLNIMCP
jgi:hypothetical protein